MPRHYHDATEADAAMMTCCYLSRVTGYLFLALRQNRQDKKNFVTEVRLTLLIMIIISPILRQRTVLQIITQRD